MQNVGDQQRLLWYFPKCPIHPCHTAAILSRETKRALFYQAKPRNGNHGDEQYGCLVIRANRPFSLIDFVFPVQVMRRYLGGLNLCLVH